MVAAPAGGAAARSPEAAFAALVDRDPGRPVVTYYDEASGERSELSAKSLANWVAKTHFLLRDELALGPGDRAVVDLPLHWIAVPVVLGCLSAGLELRTGADPEAAVAFVEPASVASAAGVPDVYAVAPDRAAVGFGAGAPGGTADYVTAVRPQPDAWATVHAAGGPADPALDGLDRAALGARAAARAAQLGLAGRARVLCTRERADAATLLDALFAPLAVGGAVVWVRGADEETVARRAQQERATTRL